MKRVINSRKFGKVVFELVGERIRATWADARGLLTNELWLGGSVGWKKDGGRYQAPIAVKSSLGEVHCRHLFEYEVLLWWRYYRLHQGRTAMQRFAHVECPDGWEAVPR